jgi:HK97 family phage prohead protease
MPKKPEREYRAMPLMNGTEYRAEGYATTFNDPYVLFRDEDVTYYESVDPNAIDEKTDMSDVIMQFDHEGMVFARMSNDTLQISSDEHGLKVVADLSKTADARNMFENIQSGMVKDMSWAFTVDGQRYDKETHTRVITHVRKIFDVSAVSLPANPSTEIMAARSFIDGEIEKEIKEFEKRESKKAKLRLMLELGK